MSTQTESTAINYSPSNKLQALSKLLGSWIVTGGATGTVTYRWMDGGFFLLQEVDLIQNDMQIKGIEVIGHLRPFEQPASDNIVSRFYDNHGNTFDYEYELEGNQLTIWAGGKGSDAYFRGVFSEDGKSNQGAWVYPGGYGYESTMTLQTSSGD
ncbi:hypothetical protein [Rheinheimera sp.]|uniref:hypothetical protein n=1 Tax=Rheinheimera sp. TaxID=1869214 RepID=UPI0037C7E243